MEIALIEHSETAGNYREPCLEQVALERGICVRSGPIGKAATTAKRLECRDGRLAALESNCWGCENVLFNICGKRVDGAPRRWDTLQS